MDSNLPQLAEHPWCLGLYEKALPSTFSLQEKLAAARAAEYDFLELSIDETDEKLTRLDWSTQQTEQVRRSMVQSGIPISSICLSAHRRFPLGSHDPILREKSLVIMQKAIDLAARLGAQVIQLAGYDVYYETSDMQTKQWFFENLKKSVYMAARKGILLGFETMETPFLDTVEKAMIWVSQIHSPYLQIYPDLGNLTNASMLYKTNVCLDLQKGGKHLIAMHLKETVPGRYREIPYGTGHVDFQVGIQTAWAQGVRMFVGEFWHLGEPDPLKTLLHNRDFLTQKIESCIMETMELS